LLGKFQHFPTLPNYKWALGMDYSMTAADSTKLINAIRDFAAAKEAILKDTARIVVRQLQWPYGIEEIRVSQIKDEGFVQYNCGDLSHVITTDEAKLGKYAYSLYGGHSWYSQNVLRNQFNLHSSATFVWQNEYPVYELKNGQRLPVMPDDDAFIRVLKAVSGNNHAFGLHSMGEMLSMVNPLYADFFVPTRFNKGMDEMDWAWNTPFTTSHYSALDRLSRDLSSYSVKTKTVEYTSTAHFTDGKGNFQIGEVIKAWDVFANEAEKKLYIQYIEDVLTAMFCPDYLLSFTTDQKLTLDKVWSDYTTKQNKQLIDYAAKVQGYADTLSWAFTIYNEDGTVKSYPKYSVEYNKERPCIKVDNEWVDLLSIATKYKAALGEYDSWADFMAAYKKQVLKDGPFAVESVQKKVKALLDARKDFADAFTAYNLKVTAYNGKVKAAKDSIDKYNAVYNKFWGLKSDNQIVKPNYTAPVAAKNSDKNFYSKWVAPTPASIKPEEGKRAKVNWAISTFGNAKYGDKEVANDIIIPIFDPKAESTEGNQLQNFNDKLAIVLANLENNAGEKPEAYNVLYSNPEASYIIFGGAGYTELVKLFMAKYTYLLYSNYTENEEAFAALVTAVENLEKAYNEQLKAAEAQFAQVKAVVAEYLGAVEGDYNYVGGNGFEGESTANFLDFFKNYEELVAELQDIANGVYYKMVKHDDDEAEEAEDDWGKQVKKEFPYDYTYFLEKHVTDNGADAYIYGLGEGKILATAEKLMGEYINKAFARDQKIKDINGYINDVLAVSQALEKTYTDYLEYISDEDLDNKHYTQNFEELYNILGGYYATAQAAALAAQKALDMLAANYDPQVINKSKIQLELSVLEQQLEVAKTALEAAKAQYEAVIAKYAAK